MIPELPPQYPSERFVRSGDLLTQDDSAAGGDTPSDPPNGFAPKSEPDVESMQIPADRMVGLRFIKAALGRHRRLWLGAAAIGLVLGALYHVVVPLKYSATSTVYIAHASTAAGTVAAQNDLAMLQTNAVATRALAQLHEPGLTASGLLGKLPGTLLSQNVLEITTSGPSPELALRRVTALTSAYLSFRAQKYDQQSRAIVAASTAQVVKLQAEVTALSAKIVSPLTSTGQQTVLEAQRTAALSQITGLEAAIQQDELNQLAVSNGSKVLGSATLVSVSKKKVFLLDGLTGLAAGLGLGLLLVVTFAMLGDRVHRREDVAAILGAPVALSIKRPSSRWWRGRRSAPRISRRDLRVLVRYLRGRLRDDAMATSALVVPIGDARVAAAALVSLSDELICEGATVALVDATDHRILAHGMRRELSEQRSRASRNSMPPPSVLSAPLPRDGAEIEDWKSTVAKLRSTSKVLALASVDPAFGASHLRSLSHEAIVTVSAGRTSVQQISATAEMLDAAGIVIGSAVLLDADPGDDTVGLPTENATRLGALHVRRATT